MLTFLMLTGKRFEQAVAISDCCIVTLEKGLKGMCAPSKFYSYLQGGKPVLAVVEEGSYLQEEICREGIGDAVPLGEADRLAQLIRQLSEDSTRIKEMGHRAQKLYDGLYAMQIGVEEYKKMFQELL